MKFEIENNGNTVLKLEKPKIKSASTENTYFSTVGSVDCMSNKHMSVFQKLETNEKQEFILLYDVENYEKELRFEVRDDQEGVLVETIKNIDLGL